MHSIKIKDIMETYVIFDSFGDLPISARKYLAIRTSINFLNSAE